MLKFVILAAFVAAASAVAIPVESCGDGYNLPESFAIPECPGLPCSLPIGANINLNIGIRVARLTTQLPVTATVTQNDATSDWKLPTGDACNGVVGGCPLAVGSHAINFPLTIADVESGVPAIIRVDIKDDAGNSVACGVLETTFN